MHITPHASNDEENGFTYSSTKLEKGCLWQKLSFYSEEKGAKRGKTHKHNLQSLL